MASLRLDTVKAEIAGFWDSAQAQFRIRSADAARSRGDWTTATHRLLQLADLLDSVDPKSPAWRELAVAALESAALTDDANEVRGAASRLLGRSWTLGWVPDELIEAFRAAEKRSALRGGRELGLVMERRFPGWPHGPYAAAHFADALVRRDRTTFGEVHAEVRRFERAADLFGNRGDALAANHCRLRAAELLIEHTPQTERARRLLKAVDQDRLAPRERLWHALALAHSPFWLDRVRAGDFVSDVMDGLDRHDPDYSDYDADSVFGVGEALFARLPVRLQDAELDRLQALVGRFEGSRGWELEAQLRGRESAASYADRQLGDLTAAEADALQADALPLDGFAALAAAWRGDEVAVLPLDSVARDVVAALEALDEPDDALAGAMRELTKEVVNATDPRALRPIAVLLPRLLARELHDSAVHAAATELALHYAHRAPEPSYGFWSLAANLFAAKLSRAGAAATKRAIDEGAAVEEGLARDLIARSVQWAIQEGSDREMLEWLEVGHGSEGGAP